mgnify:CR=1 FL=1
MTAENAPVRVLAADVEQDEVLQGDDVAFHAQHFGDVSYLAAAVAQTSDLHDDVDRAGDHLAERVHG